MATVRSYGATKEVTGSCHVLEVEGVKIMVDCGMFQGEEEEKNKEAFYFESSSIDYILLTHAHLDHVGRIPKLVKEGFKGKIYATKATMDLAEIILTDSAKIMSEDFQTRYRKAQRKGRAKKVEKPLYTPLDVEQTFKMIKWVHPEYDNYYDLCEGISFVFKNAGHILGSAFIEVSYMDDNDSRSIVFTGDIGNNNELVLPNLTQCERADYLYTETTYGDRDHQPIEATLQEFKETLLTTLERGGNVLIPSFAVERTQEILCILKEMFENDELPKRSQVFLDSPMATRATEVYESYNYELTDKCNNFDFNGLVFTETPEASKNINNVEKGAIIIAGAGMCNGGRIVHHFKHRIWNEKNAVIFVGFQAEKTLGREIVEGAKWINVLGEDIIVKASIHTINGFSAHADRDGMIRWISGIKNLQKVFLVHGEIESQNAFKETLKKELNIDAHIVGFKEKIVLD